MCACWGWALEERCCVKELVWTAGAESWANVCATRGGQDQTAAWR